MNTREFIHAVACEVRGYRRARPDLAKAVIRLARAQAKRAAKFERAEAERTERELRLEAAEAKAAVQRELSKQGRRQLWYLEESLK